MLVLLHLDWFGSTDELGESDEEVKKTCSETAGVKYQGRYTPNQKKYHWTYVFMADSFACWEDAWNQMAKRPRDYQKLPYGELEYLQGPYHE
jgi:hypothetical protein